MGRCRQGKTVSPACTLKSTYQLEFTVLHHDNRRRNWLILIRSNYARAIRIHRLDWDVARQSVAIVDKTGTGNDSALASVHFHTDRHEAALGMKSKPRIDCLGELNSFSPSPLRGLRTLWGNVHLFGLSANTILCAWVSRQLSRSELCRFDLETPVRQFHQCGWHWPTLKRALRLRTVPSDADDIDLRRQPTWVAIRSRPSDHLNLSIGTNLKANRDVGVVLRTLDLCRGLRGGQGWSLRRLGLLLGRECHAQSKHGTNEAPTTCTLPVPGTSR